MLSGENDLQSIPIWFKIPEQIHRLDLNESSERRIKRSYENVSLLMKEASLAEQMHVVFLQEMVISRLLAEGAVYVGYCLSRSEADPSKLATAQFSILVKKASLNAARPLAAVASSLRGAGGVRKVGFADYPAGEALVVGEEVEVRLPVSITGKSIDSSHRVRQAQVIFPFPDGKRIAILGVSSESVEDWGHFVAILNGIASSFSFVDPSKRTIGDRLAGL